MCNIKNETNLKQVEVYKLVIKKKGKYYSYFAGCPIKIGSVKFDKRWRPRTLRTWNDYEKGSWLFNSYVVGRTTGFARLEPAMSLLRHNSLRFYWNDAHLQIIKLVLGGSIYEGDASEISECVDERETTYAGSEILSIEEVKV